MSDDWNRPTYPGLAEADWRESSEQEVPAQSNRLARQVVEEATRDHAGKHQQHLHPFCEHCALEVYREGQPGRTWQELHAEEADLRRDGVEPQELFRLVSMWREHDTLPDPDQIAGGLNVTLEVAERLRDHVVAREDLDYDLTTTKTSAHRRAIRYLLLHRTPPKDDYDPAAEDASGFDQEYLDRDQLDDLPTPEPLIDGVLVRHAYGLLTGRDQTWKTFTSVDWALCLATGKPWQGRTVEPTKVLYIAGEGAHGIAQRVDAWEHHWGQQVDPERFVVRKSAVNLFRGGAAFLDLLTRVRDGGYGLVVVDTLRRASGGANSNGDDMGVVVDNVERIKRATADGSVLVIAHTQRDDNDARGFTGIEDDADFVWHAKRENGRQRLELKKMKDGQDGTVLELEPVEALNSLVMQAATSGVTTVGDTNPGEAALLSTLIVAFSESPATSTALRDSSGLPKTTYYRALNQLIKRGHVQNVGTKRQPLFQAASHVVPGMDIAADLRLSQQSQPFPVQSHGVPPSPTPRRGGTWDQAVMELTTDLEERIA